MDGVVSPPSFRFPPPNLPRDYNPPLDGIRQLESLTRSAPNGQFADAFLYVRKSEGGTKKPRRIGKSHRKTLFTDTLPQVWNANASPYGMSDSQQARPKSASKEKNRTSRKRPRSAASSSSLRSRLPSTRSQGTALSYASAHSDLSAYAVNSGQKTTKKQRAESARADKRRDNSNLLVPKGRSRKKNKWTAASDPALLAASLRRNKLMARKRQRARLFHEQRGLRVNDEGLNIDGAVSNLNVPSREITYDSEDPESEFSNQRTVLHRSAKGPVEITAEQHIEEDEQKKHEMLGSSSNVWLDSDHAYKDGFEDHHLDSEANVDSDAEVDFYAEAPSMMDGPASLRHLPEGRIPWALMLSGKILPSDLLWHDLRHSKPILMLNLSNMNVTDSLFLNVLTVENSPHIALKELLLRNCSQLTDATLYALSSCRLIRVLDVAGCKRLTDDGFVQFSRTHSLLRSVDLSGCSLVTHKGVSALAVGCRRLDTLIAAELDLDDVALRGFAKQASVPFSAKFKHLDFRGSCARATDGSMMSVVSGLAGVRYVSLSEAPQVTDVSIAPFSRSGFRALRALDVANMNIGDAGLSWIAAGCSSGLRELNLSGCCAVSDDGIGQISAKCTTLTHLSLAGCRNITDQAVEALAKSLGPAGLTNPYRKYKIKSSSKMIRKSSTHRLPGHKKSQLASPREVAAAEAAAEKEDEAREEAYASVPSGLRLLDLSDCQLLTDRSLCSLGEHCETLMTLVLVGVNSITDSGLSHLNRIGWRIRSLKADKRRKELVALQKKYGGTENFPLHVKKEQKKRGEELPYQPLRSLNFAGRFRVSNVGLNTHFGVARLTDHGVSNMLYGPECYCSSLTNLNFTGLAYVGDHTMKAIAKACGSSLVKLSVSGCGRISDAGIAALCAGCTSLVDLNLAGCQRIGDESLKALANSSLSKILKKINLFKCRGVTDRGIRHFLACKALEYVNLRTCVNITDGGLVAWSQVEKNDITREGHNSMGAFKTGPCLLNLNLTGLPEITMLGITAISRKFTRLCRLDAGGCENILRSELLSLVSDKRKRYLPGARISPNPKTVALVPSAPTPGLCLLHAFVEHKEHQHLAAERIQRRWRYRMSMQRKLREALEERARMRRMRKYASIQIQRTVFRGVSGRMKARQRAQQLHNEDLARRKLQRVSRGFLGRQKAIQRKKHLAYVAEKRRLCSVAIQRVVYRGWKGRQIAFVRRTRFTKAVIKLQGWIRIVWAMMEHDRLLKAHRKLVRKRDNAARRIQVWRRGIEEQRSIMSAYLRLLSSTLKIQTWVRQWQTQRRVEKWRVELTQACIVVQRCFRMAEARFLRFLLRRARSERQAHENACSLLIQTCLVRPWFARRRVYLEMQRERAATLFQAAWQYFKAKRSKRVLRLLARQEERERAIIEAKAREMYAQWRIEDDMRPDSLASRQRSMLEAGAALRIQKLWMRSKIFRRIRSIMQWKKNLAAVHIQAFVRGCWARRYYKWERRVWRAVTYRISKWWRAFAVQYAYRDAKKIREARRRAEQLEKKKVLIEKAWQRRKDALLERTRQRAAKVIQMEWRAYVVRKITAAKLKVIKEQKEKEIHELEAYRAKVRAEQIERQSLKGKLKRWKAFLTNPKAIKKRLLPDKRDIELRLDQIKAKWDAKTRERLLRGEFESLMYSIQARQKEAIAQSGVVDIALTVGEDDYLAFRKEQHLRQKEGLPFFVTNKVDIFSTYYEMSEGQKIPRPKWIMLWTQTAHNRTSHIITTLEIRRRPKGLNELKYRDYLDKVEEDGWTVKWSRKCRFEIRYRRDGKHMIRALQAESVLNKQAKLLKTGWNHLHMPPGEHEAEVIRAMKKSAAKAGRKYVEPPSDGVAGESKASKLAALEYEEISSSIDPECIDFGMYGYDAGTKVFVRHALPKKGDRAMEAHFEALKKSDGTYADISQNSMDEDGLETLLDQVEFAGYSAHDIDKLRAKFNYMDEDASGTVDVDEFFSYIKEKRTVLSQHIFEFHDIEFGGHFEEELLDFGHFVKTITTVCLFDSQLLIRFFFNLFDKENKRYILKTEARQLLLMLQHQEPGVCTRGQCDRACLMLGIIGSGQGQGIVTFEDFLELSERCPTVVYPLFKLQHTLRTTFLGMKYWERKLQNMAKARELVFAARHNGAELIQGDVTGNLLNLSEKKDHEKRKQKRQKRTQKWKKKQSTST